MWKRVPKFLRNRYSITAVVFVVWLLFFENIDVVSLYRYRSRLNDLEMEKVKHRKDIDATNQALHELTSNPEMLEKFAREKYFMKKSNEVLYVFAEEDAGE